ncbi:MAG: fibronectin type III domain-containing protein [Candidatus Peregrinibacteria bacterium]
MKKGIGLIIGILLALPSFAQAQEVMTRITIQAVPTALNLIITQPSDKSQWLLKLKSCSTPLQKGQQIGLGINGSLNGRNDYIDLGYQRRCEIKEAFQFNETLDVLSANRNQAGIRNEKGERYVIFIQEDCRDLTSLPNDKLYAMRFGYTIAAGDTVLIPGEPKKCSIKLVKRIQEKEEVKLPAQPLPDKTRPTQVSRVRAIPRTGKVFLYWNAAADNVGVDHYVISYMEYKTKPKTLTFDSAPNKIKTTQTRLTINNLENDRNYYFYVMAVDKAGNKSSLWSEPAYAQTSSAISPDPIKETGQQQLHLRKTHESEQSILIQWDAPPTATRYLVTLIADKKTEFSLKEYAGTKVRILKRDSRKGKALQLKVSAFNPRGFIGEETIEFTFDQ